MSELHLKCKAIKIVKKPGGYPTKTVVEEYVDAMGIKHRSHKHYVSRVRVAGSEYVVFKCPSCGRRNNRGLYDVKGRVGSSLVFKCHGCYNMIEVAPPGETNKIDRVPLLYAPDGRPIQPNS